MSQARALAEERLRELAELSLEELLRYEQEAVDEEITAPSGRVYRIRTDAFWDMNPHDSLLYVQVRVKGRGSRWWDSYGGTHLRDPEDEFSPNPEEGPEVTSTWVEGCTCLTLALIVLGLPLLGIVKLLELLRRLGMHHR